MTERVHAAPIPVMECGGDGTVILFCEDCNRSLLVWDHKRYDFHAFIIKHPNWMDNFFEMCAQANKWYYDKETGEMYCPRHTKTHYEFDGRRAILKEPEV